MLGRRSRKVEVEVVVKAHGEWRMLRDGRAVATPAKQSSVRVGCRALPKQGSAMLNIINMLSTRLGVFVPRVGA